MKPSLASSLILVAALGAGCATPEKAAVHDHGSAPASSASAAGAGHAVHAGMADGHAMMMAPGQMAAASLTPTQGQGVRGLVIFHAMGSHLMVHARVSGLKPGAEHGFHLHEKGDCASTDGTSAGGHFNPDGQPHGPQSAAHHAGDLPALKADANGVADQKFMIHGPTLSAGPASLDGRSVIVHANPDDYATQPTGNSGARIACGVVAVH